MKYRFIGILIIFILFYQVGYSQWYNEKFQIGSFADPRVSRDNNRTKDSISFTLFRAARFNLLTGPQYYNGAQDFSLMDKTLDLAAKYNLHLMVIDSKLLVTNNNFSNDDAQKIVSHFKTIDSKRRNAIGGYSFGGEFPLAKAAQVKKWTNYFKNNDPDKPAFVYLMPNYGFKSRSAYEEYLDGYLNDQDAGNRPQIVAYDYYPFLSPAIMSSYFYNLGIIKEKAAGRPVWYYIQSTTKKTLPDITDYQLKFMAYCPLAYGSKGAIYYTYESIPDHYGLNYYDALINPYGNTTKKYYTAKIINYYLSLIAGPIVMENRCVGTYHVSNGPTNENIPDNYILTGRNKYVRSISNKNILIGVFKDQQSRKYYLMLINKSSNDLSDIKISVPGNKSVTAFPGSDNYRGSMTKTQLFTTNDRKRTTTSFNLEKIPGGEMAIVEVD
jgi:hypothetical protein